MASSETCPAGAGSLLLELGLLTYLLEDPVYEGYARRATKALWNCRAKSTGLLGLYRFFQFNFKTCKIKFINIFGNQILNEYQQDICHKIY